MHIRNIFRSGKRLAILSSLLGALTGVQLIAWQADTQTSSVKEPEYINEFFRLGSDGQLMPLEQEKLASEMKNHRNFVISPSITTEKIVPNRASPVRVPPDAHFVVKMNAGGQDPARLITLKPFVVKKKDREIPQSKASAGIVPFAGVKSQTAPDSSIALNIKKYGNGSFEVAPASPLAAGEYAFVSGLNASCFGVDSTPAK